MDEWKRPQDELPKIGKRVLVAVGRSEFTRSMAIAGHIPKHSVVAEDFLCEDDLNDGFVKTGDDGIEYVPSGWYELPMDGDRAFLIVGEVVCWREIPTPPDCF